MSANISRVAGLCTSLLLSASPLMAAGSDLRLVNAAAGQDKAAVRALLKERVDVNATRADGSTALLWAAHWNDLEMVDLLIRAGANVNAADDHGVTALARAAENADLAMAERLLKARANANLAETSGRTPLMVAAKTGNVQLVKALLANGANVNASTVLDKYTPLMWAITERHDDIANVLVEGQADVHAVSAKGFTPLMFAARTGNIPMAKTLLAAGARVNDVAPDGTHVLPFSIISGQADFTLFLLDQGADPNGAIGGVRALHTAVGSADLWLADWYRSHGLGGGYAGMGSSYLPTARRAELTKALLARGADANARAKTSAMHMGYIGYPKKGAFEPFACGTGDLLGATPLWVAANAASGNQLQIMEAFGVARTDGYGAIIKALLDAGADLTITTTDGTTPLMSAAGLGGATFIPGKQRGFRMVGSEEAVKLLLEAGADVNATNEADFTALHGAAMRGLNEVVEHLVSKGAKINARDFRGRTPYRLAEGAKQSFQFQAFPETAELFKKLGADTTLGIPGTVHERLRDVTAPNATQQQQQ
jgi:ankyrin repeat protein